MTLSPELLNAIEAGCDGVTPGPWRNDNGEGYSINSIWAPKRILVAQAVGDSAEADANAAHIARLDPATVLELVAGYRAGLKAHADVIRLRALLARIRSALEVPHV
jgi:hypothetical protein